MEMKGGEVILPLDEQLCLLLYTFSPSPVSAILEILIVLCSLAATASLLILLFTPICPWLKVGRQSLWRWGGTHLRENTKDLVSGCRGVS